ncbi:Endonuclease/exonuclease/phosphatase [Chaetomium tenue]|uniref:Endonuclease/exonuclease/phosphatase n=1 Tax=Chaetomium tenue TaxID=1854479 RepID=A0ACB7P5D5_9PEZI|nr:Endonuclease/exonuclease/phosphatase [Chaetomium globosum]
MKSRNTSIDAAAMAPSTLDLFILTFNCAKTFINPPVFAAHLHGAFAAQNTADLPDLVVFSLQEVAPLSYAFIGSYFLNPYYARFGEALNLASAKVLATADTDDERAPLSAAAPRRGTPPPYTLVRAKNVGMTAILMYARDPTSIRNIEEAECGFGAADMGNKGAAGLRVTWSGQADETGLSKTTELTFVATHLAAMEWNLKKRNANWRSIVAGLTFSNPRTLLPDGFPADQAGPTLDRTGAGDSTSRRLPTGDSPDPSEEEQEDSEEEEEESTHPLLPHPQLPPTTPATTLAALHALSIYKPTSHLFVSGDLNYRISNTTPPPSSVFPSFDPSSEHHHPHFLPRDQLTRERRAGRTLHGLAEAPVRFGPTYKFDVLDGAEGAANEEAVRAGREVDGVPEVPWRFAPHRWPGWCDRVLYLDVPRWVSSASSGGGSEGEGEEKPRVEVDAYDALPLMACSDHRAVYFRARVPVLGAEEMAPPADIEADEDGLGLVAEDSGGMVDPRVRMPVPVDVHAWERRAAARRKEVVVGWTALLWSTREGAVLLATLLALGVGSWWLLRVW